eukprot:GHVL01016672.1.p1 GENE.GHVL01016672.1~~GHVL01016672.1.p1  ORF type:complete len:164 (-),score=10.66 GHVL01016672.1:322-813(-)
MVHNVLQTDAAVIVEKTDCSGVQLAHVKSGPVQAACLTDIVRFSDLSTNGSLCWCYNCFTSNTTDFSEYNTKIANINGPSGPPSPMNVTCKQGEDDCVLTFPASHYPTPNSSDSAIISSVACGSTTVVVDIIGYIAVHTTNTASPSFNFTSQSALPVGNYFFC